MPAMPFVDTGNLKVIERKPGWHGRFFDSANMSFAYYTFEKGSSIHRHAHPQEEVWHIIEGELEITIDGKKAVGGPGYAGIVPAGCAHEVKALSDGRAIIVDYPLRDIPGE
jgi:quercetin dioxygenase-like cupin family protein